MGLKLGANKIWDDRSFAYPTELKDLELLLAQHTNTNDLYFCPTPLSKRNRIKANVPYSYCLWADLDDCPPEKLLVKPTILIETSPNRHQAYWKLKSMGSPIDVEDANRRICYYHREDGCDPSGWDLSQMMRIPGTYNFKGETSQPVKILDYDPKRLYDISDFNEYPEVEQIDRKANLLPFPKKLPDTKAEDILKALEDSAHPRVWRLFKDKPDVDWSSNIWDLEQTLFEVGATPEDVFVVVRDAACNKFKRDGLGDHVLWKEVLRAQAAHKRHSYGAVATDTRIVSSDRDLLSNDDRKFAEGYSTFIDQYVEWGAKASDAPQQYHVGGALIILSSIMANKIKLPTSFGYIIPNIWIMILADTTLTRKTTTMDMAMDIISAVNPAAMLATDGSVEGIMQSMSIRQGQTSIFVRDEISGLMDQMNRRDYMSGMMETLTKLYDNKPYKRTLKKETIEVIDPVFIFYAGGVKDKTYALSKSEHILSGFFPRFVFITAEADFNRIRPMGPPTDATIIGKSVIQDRVTSIFDGFNINVGGRQSVFTDPYRTCELTREAWSRLNSADEIMQHIGYNSGTEDLLTPMLTRLNISGLKIAMLIAGSEQMHEEQIKVGENHIIKALSYIENFKHHAIQVVNNTGRSTTEKTLQRVVDAIYANSGGLARSLIMQRFSLMARDADNVLETLKQRGMIREDRVDGVRMLVKRIN